jgi:serine/threonine protein phosphatase PrpC
MFVCEGIEVNFAVSKEIQAGGSELQDRVGSFWNGPNLILVLADGAGGLSGGAKAAEFVVQSVKSRINSTIVNSGQLCSFLTALDREMSASGTLGETTCVIVILSETGVIGASVGDSGALIFSKDRVDNLTKSQIRKPLLGSGQASPIGFNRSHLDGTLLLASDGLLKYTSEEKIAATISTSNFDETANKLTDLVRYRSGALPDDVSVLLVRKQEDRKA